MSGAEQDDEDVTTGRVNRAESTTSLWAQVQPGDVNFNGYAILVAEVAPLPLDLDDYDEDPLRVQPWMPDSSFHGVVARANGEGIGVAGRGGAGQGTGVVGHGGGVEVPGTGGLGGIGVHGVGGEGLLPSSSTVPPGAGLVGQGGRQHALHNFERLPHGAGLIGLAGSYGQFDPYMTLKSSTEDKLSDHPLSNTGSVGVYGQGADARLFESKMSDEQGKFVGYAISGPIAPGPGVMGRGGIGIGGKGIEDENDRIFAPDPAAGVIGLSGGGPVPDSLTTANVGVYGEGLTGVMGLSRTGPGVVGVSTSSRGAIFHSSASPQLRLAPQSTEVDIDLSNEVPVGASEVQGPEQRVNLSLPKDGRPGDLITKVDSQGAARLWFCVRDGRWAQVLLGTEFDGTV